MNVGINFEGWETDTPQGSTSSHSRVVERGATAARKVIFEDNKKKDILRGNTKLGPVISPSPQGVQEL
jgi:hypothetical protein